MAVYRTHADMAGDPYVVVDQDADVAPLGAYDGVDGSGGPDSERPIEAQGKYRRLECGGPSK